MLVYDVCRMRTFVAFDVCRFMTFVANYDVCRLKGLSQYLLRALFLFNTGICQVLVEQNYQYLEIVLRLKNLKKKKI